MDYSFGLLKPDCLKGGIEKKVLSEIKIAGLEIVAVKRVRLTRKEVDIMWEPCQKDDFYKELLKFSLSGDCLVFIVRGNDAINRFTDLVGHYEPTRARKDTIRHRFGISAMENVIHSINDEKTFWREALLFFSQSELNQLIKDQEVKEGKKIE